MWSSELWRESWFSRLSTVMIRLSARDAFSTSREGAYSRQGTYLFFQKQPNVQNKT